MLSFFAETFCLHRPLAGYTRYQYSKALKRFCRWAGREVHLSDLSDDLLNGWVLFETNAHQISARTIRNKRNMVLTVWRYAAKLGLAQRPANIREVPVPRKLPVAWTIQELRNLLAVAAMVAGSFRSSGVPRRDYFTALFRCAYETGLRRSDLHGLHIDTIDEAGNIVVVQHKTGDGHRCSVRPETRELLLQISATLRANGKHFWETPLRWPAQVRDFYEWMRKLCLSAQIRHGALQQLRRTGATHLERENPGAAQAFLGHRTPGLAHRSYLDRRLAFPPRLPPAI